jgi:hypothetical protein
MTEEKKNTPEEITPEKGKSNRSRKKNRGKSPKRKKQRTKEEKKKNRQGNRRRKSGVYTREELASKRKS